jgi:hypothetical protein
VKYFRLFKAKKPIGKLSQSERREFANDLASSILDNILSPNIHALAISVKEDLPENFKNTSEDFLRICKARETLKTIEHETLDKVFEKNSLDFLKYLNSIKAIKEENLIDIATNYLTLNWIDDAIHKRSSDIYTQIIAIRSSLTKSNSWTPELEAAYRETSFGSVAVKPSIFVSCSVVIKQKDRFKLFDSAWDKDLWPVISSVAYKDSIAKGSIEIWQAMNNGMIPDLHLVFREFSGWLK